MADTRKPLCFVQMPRPYFGTSVPYAFAHRGGALRWPENTLVAFQGAADLGITHIETDIHLSADGHFACFHDSTLERTTNGRGSVADRTLAELKKLDAGYHFAEDGGFPYRGADARIPSLEEALGLDPTLRYNLEVKPADPRLARRLWELIEHHGVHDRVLVASEHDSVTEAFRALSRGRVATSSGRRSALRFWGHVLSGTWRDAVFPFDALQIPPRFKGIEVITPRFVEAAHHHGIQVHVWTINDPDDMARLASKGVDAIMTDLPDVLMELLTET